MGVVLDPGKSADYAEQERDTPRIGWQLFRFALSCLVVAAIVIIMFAAPSESTSNRFVVAIFVAAIGSMVLAYLLAKIAFSVQESMIESWGNNLTGSQPTTGPADTLRTELRFTPQDGALPRVGRLGGGGTHIVNSVSGNPYVIVVADNGFGVTTAFESRTAARLWAEEFVRARPNKKLHREVLYHSIEKLQIHQTRVIIWTEDQGRIELLGWFDPVEKSHRAQVRRLIETLGFIEDSPGRYARDSKPYDSELATSSKR